MRISMLMCKQVQPPPELNIPAGGLSMDNIFTPHNNYRHKEKVVVIMGATGAGKSRLSIDLSIRYPAEIINSDKMQVYRGLDVVTNKITDEEKCGVPHHLLGTIDPDQEFTSQDFCDMASLAIGSISSRKQLPIIVGGSNSYLDALINDKSTKFRAQYECCFLWVDVSMPILHSFVSDRVDQMVKNGMVDEVREMFDLNANYTRGVRKAIGVPEFDRYFREGPYLSENSRKKLLEDAINAVKSNTCKLARRQLEKIHRLRNLYGWKMHRIDATEVFRRKHANRNVDEVWEKHVADPSSAIVFDFLYNALVESSSSSFSVASHRGVSMETAVATTYSR